MRLNRYLLSPDAADGSTPTPEVTPAPVKHEAVSDLAIFAKKIADLERDNAQYREKLRKHKEAASTPTPSPALSPEDASLLDAYRSLGKPDDIHTLKAERDQMAARLAGLERDSALRTIAEQVGGKASVLMLAAAAHPDAAFTVAEVKGQDGKPAKVLHVKEGEGEPRPFAERFPDIAASFQPNGQPTARVPGTPPRGTQAATPTPAPDAQPAVRRFSI